MTVALQVEFETKDYGDQVCVMTLSAAPFNVLTPAILDDMRRGVEKAVAKGSRVILIRSSIQGQFSQGLDPKTLLDADIAGRKLVFQKLGQMTAAFRFAGIPTLVDVSGPAIAGGAVLVALADFALIDVKAGRICFSEVKVGLPIPSFLQVIIKSKILPGARNEVMLLGRNIDAADAVRIGLVNQSYQTSDDRDELVDSYIGRITRLPRAVIRHTLLEGRGHEHQAFKDFAENIGDFADFLTDEYLGKGLKAILKGESPKFN